MRRWLPIFAVLGAVVALGVVVHQNSPRAAGETLLNVSYDPTRELYQSLNSAFEAEDARRNGRPIRILQSHGGSSRQSLAVATGEQSADVVTLGLYSDVDALRKRGLIAANWADRLPFHSQPYTSTIVFVVRAHNPKEIRDWPDLIRPGIEIVTPDPKTSGNGKLSALAAWGAIVKRGGTENDAINYLVAFYQHVRVLDAGARGAAMTFALAEMGDVHLTWENEAIREVAESKGSLQLVYPPISILAEPYVAWVDSNVSRHGSANAARSYLEFLFSHEAQQIMADLGYRPSDPTISRAASPPLPAITLFPITDIAHDWDDAQNRFFTAGGLIDGILREAHP